MGRMSYYVEDLFSTHRLSILAHVQTLTIYHVSDLFATHSPVGSGKAIHYGFFYLHMTKILNLIHIFALL